MLFTSPTFLFIFLPIVFILVQLIIKNTQVKNLFLFIFSMAFYFWGESNYISLILFSIFINFSLGYLLSYYEEKPQLQKLTLGLGIVINLSLLVYFKYYEFMLDSIPFLTHILPLKKVILPLGISFFTFHGITYIVDIYRKDAIASKNPLNVGLYILFFPQLIAGPIVRYKDIYAQLLSRTFSTNKLRDGVQRFIAGLFKKMIIANTMGYIADDILNKSMHEISPSLAWLAMLCYTFQIFFDFSAYSDMAIGLAKMFGFDFIENFNYPYIAKSIKDFWRRWHISLSTFFRDYVYIPLGGNRDGLIRNLLYLLFVFFLTGLWHGASFNFIIWGLFHGFFLTIEKFINIESKNKLLDIPRHIYTMLVVIIAWVFFRVEKLEDALSILKKMFYIHPANDATLRYTYYLDNYNLTVILLALLLSLPIAQWLKEKMPTTAYTWLTNTVLLLMFAWSLLVIAAASYNPFIYFRF